MKSVADPIPSLNWWSKRNKALQRRIELMQNRAKIRIGMPRVLYMYSYAPVFNGYFQALGIPPENIVYSDYTIERPVPRGRQPRRDRPVLPGQDRHRRTSTTC